jgi:hypothetical protein
MWDDILQDEEFYKKRKIDGEQYKEIVLDHNFLKAQTSRWKKKDKSETTTPMKKPFIKTGIIIFIIAIIAIFSIQYLPWMFLKYDTTSGTIEYIIERDLKMTDSDIEVMNPEINNLFSSPKSIHGRYSDSYVGLTFSDFTNIPETSFNLFFILMIISIIFTIFLIIDKFRNFDMGNVTMIYSGFAATCIIFSLVIFAICLKFIASYIVLYLNWPFIQDLGINDIRLVYIVPIIIIILSLTIIKSCITVLKLNYRDIVNRLETKKSEERFLMFKFGAPEND